MTAVGSLPRWTVTSIYPSLSSPEFDAALADGAIPPGKRERLLKKIDFMRGAVQAYKGPDVQALRDFFQRTLGEVVLAG